MSASSMENRTSFGDARRGLTDTRNMLRRLHPRLWLLLSGEINS